VEVRAAECWIATARHRAQLAPTGEAKVRTAKVRTAKVRTARATGRKVREEGTHMPVYDKKSKSRTSQDA
jgi:hypothetical protein